MVKTVFTSKLGTARGVERSRIWIEGNRLVNAGFTVGLTFSKRWTEGKLVLSLGDDGETGTVSGKGEKPIIDIVGEKVRNAFPSATHVKVTYDHGRIVIVAAD